MVSWLIGSGLRFRRLVIAVSVGVLGLGIAQVHGAAVDVYPEFDAPAVQVQAEALGLSAQEVEQLITVPLEQDLLNGIPWLEHIRSKSMPGLAAIDLVFEPGTNLYRARQMVQERMTQAKALPNVGTPPIMVQPEASTSRIAMIGLRSQTVSLVDMSVLARWQIRPRLMSIPGVANVSIWGQRDRQLQVQVDPERLRASKVTLTQLIESTGNALWVSPLSFVEASTPGTGGFVETPNQRLGVQHISPITTSKQLAEVSVEDVDGKPTRLGNVANVTEDHQPLIGDAGLDGQQTLMLVVERFPDADIAKVTGDVDAALAAMAPGLSGIKVDANVFRPATYLDDALSRLGLVALLGLLLMLAIMGALTLSWRIVLICAVTIPLSLVTAAYVLFLRGTTLTTMTLVGLAAVLAILVDDAIGDVTYISDRLERDASEPQRTTASVVTEAVIVRRSPLFFATLIVLLALCPFLLLSGVAGAFARPALLSYALALLASLVVALVVTPTLAVLLLEHQDRSARVAPLTRWVHNGFDRLTARSIHRPLFGFVAVALLAAVALSAIPQHNSGRVLPVLQDRNVLVRLQGAPGTSLAEMNRITNAAAGELRALQGVRSAGAHVGRAAGANEIVGVDAGEIWLTIDQKADYAHTFDAVQTTVQGYPGVRSRIGTYAADRVAAASESSGDDLVVRIYGQDLATLRSTAEDVGKVMATVEGVLSPKVQAQVSEPTVEIEVDLKAAQRAGLRPGDVRREASTLISGLTVGSLYEEQKIFDVVVWGGPATRQSVSSVQSLLIDTPSGGHVRIGDVARVRIAPSPTAISHEAVSRSLDVTATVHGRGAADVGREVTARLRELTFPYEYRAEVLGDATKRENVRQRVALMAAVVVLLAFLLFQAATASWLGAMLLLLLVPLGGVGGVLVAPLVGGIRSLGVLAAIFAVVALAVRQVLVLVRGTQLKGESGSTKIAAESMQLAAREKAPAFVGAALVTAAAFLPAALIGGRAGMEVLQPFAVTLLAGLVSSTCVVLFLVPSLYPALAGRNRLPVDEFAASEIGPRTKPEKGIEE